MKVNIEIASGLEETEVLKTVLVSRGYYKVLVERLNTRRLGRNQSGKAQVEK